MRAYRVLVSGAILALAAAVGSGAAGAELRLPPQESPAQRDARLAWWREARFGLFIHWGPASVSGREISWSRQGHPHDHSGLESVPAEAYDQLYQSFNPVRFDADAWMRLAREAGMKYVVFVAKHHDGFSLWPTALRPDYSIAASPFRRDLCGEIAAAAQRHGLKLGWYYSTRDWTHPDYLVGDNQAYDAFYRGQVDELLTRYGRVDLMWFDHVAGNWRDYRLRELFETLYRRQPGLLVNNRAAAFIRETNDRPSPELRRLVAGDFDTPEQRVGAFQNDRPWESCVTITECRDGGGWSYRPDGRTRSFEECARMLVNCAAGDGNLLLNVGPLPTGEIAGDQQEVLRRIGHWLARYGESIYGTRGGPIRNGDWGGSTYRKRTVYLHLLHWGGQPVPLPRFHARVKRATVLTGGEVAVRSAPSGPVLDFSNPQPDPLDTIIKLELSGPAEAEFREGKPLDLPPAPTAQARRSPAGYPSRDPQLDAFPGFQHPPPGYGEVPFWWWTGDPLDEARLLWQLDELHRKGISGVQVNYAHEDSPGWPTYRAEPPLFSEPWWRIWGRVADACRQRGMGIGLSTYTLDWTGAENLFRQLFYSRPELHALKLEPLPRQHVSGGQVVSRAVPADLLSARAHPLREGQPQVGGLDLQPQIREGRLEWTAPQGDWELWLVRAERLTNSLNPLLAGAGEAVVRGFFQKFQDATPQRTAEGLNYFFNDELQVGAGLRAWNADFAEEFEKRKGYRLFEALPALWADVGDATPKIRMDYADVRMALMEERYFRPIHEWHASRGLIFACDSGGRGLQPDEFGDYFRATRWYTAPGHDTPGGRADLIKGKVSSSIASLYRRPRVWLEGYHSFGWGATPAQLMHATRENYLYGCTLLNLHGLYYTTHGSFWEWAPPCYHFRMPYWEHLEVFLRYFERLSYLLSQGTFVCDVAIVYPVAPFEAGLDGGPATQAAFDTGRSLMAAGVNFEFVDADSLARAEVRDGRLCVADSAYRALIFPAMPAARWTSLEAAARFARAGGLVLCVGAPPTASDRAGRNDAQLDALTAVAFSAAHRLAKPADVPAVVLAAIPPDTRTEPPVRSLHRRVGPRDVYWVMDAAKDSTVEFRAKGLVQLWNPWDGTARPLRVLGETATGTRVQMPLEKHEGQLVVFTPGQAHRHPPAPAAPPVQVQSLEGDWQFELSPTLDNRWGDFRLPVQETRIAAEARTFRHACEEPGAQGWEQPGFDDQAWGREQADFGNQFMVLGPIPPEAATAALEDQLRQLTRVRAGDAVQIGDRQMAWQPYVMSWRWGRLADPGHQGWHGLKQQVTDHFLCLGKPVEALNETRYDEEIPGGRYFVWTSVTLPQPAEVRLRSSRPGEGANPHASAILTPAAVYLRGERANRLDAGVELPKGSSPLLVRYDRAGRGYLVMERLSSIANRPDHSTLTMQWLDQRKLLRFDVHSGAGPAEWFRFTAPPGLFALQLEARGDVQAWADGVPLREVTPGRFLTAEPLARPPVVALRVAPQPGATGGAIFAEPIRLECGVGRLPAGDWSRINGLESYSGGAWYRRDLELTAAQARGGVVLDLGQVVATAEVRVNGQVAGVCVAPPWRVDLAGRVRPGTNRLEVRVFNTLANHYSTVPTRYRGELTSGLLGPVALELSPGRATAN